MRLPGSLFRRRLARSRACSGPFRGALRGRPGERRALLSRALRRSRFFRRRANGSRLAMRRRMRARLGRIPHFLIFSNSGRGPAHHSDHHQQNGSQKRHFRPLAHDKNGDFRTAWRRTKRFRMIEISRGSATQFI